MAPGGDEGRSWLRKASGSRQQALIRRFPNGRTQYGKTVLSLAEFIGQRSEPGELKHLSTLRKRKQRDSPSSGERKGNSLNHRLETDGGVAGLGRAQAGKSKKHFLVEESGKAHHSG